MYYLTKDIQILENILSLQCAPKRLEWAFPYLCFPLFDRVVYTKGAQKKTNHFTVVGLFAYLNSDSVLRSF